MQGVEHNHIDLYRLSMRLFLLFVSCVIGMAIIEDHDGHTVCNREGVDSIVPNTRYRTYKTWTIGVELYVEVVQLLTV